MKAMRFFMVLAIMAVPMALVTSCDDDDHWDDYGYYYDDPDNGGETNMPLLEASILAGEWDGTMQYHYADNGETDNFRANIVFVQNDANSTRGTGTEYDYVLNDRGDSIVADTTLKFDWYIDESNYNIHVTYSGSGAHFVMDASATEHGFSLNGDQGVFYGYMINSSNNDMIYFDLTRQTNNSNAKSATRAGNVSSTGKFGKGIAEAMKGGVARLSHRR